MKRIYVAGPYSADNIVEALDNMRNGMRVAAMVLSQGFAPWTPWHDFHHQLMLRDGESIGIEDYYKFSVSWLEVSDAMLVLPGWTKSKGTRAEIILARNLNIPVFFIQREYNGTQNQIDALKKYFATR